MLYETTEAIKRSAEFLKLVWFYNMHIIASNKFMGIEPALSEMHSIRFHVGHT